MEGVDAKAIIAREFTGSIELGSAYSAHLLNYDTRRVRIGIDEAGRVKHPPHIG